MLPGSLVRLQKFLAEAGIASRRRCELLIAAGKVSVNGAIVTTLGTKIDPIADTVAVSGKQVRTSQPKIYLALNKPAGVICTSRDTQGRTHVLDLLPKSLPRLYSVGRLDKDTEGLLFLTNDGTFGLRLTHPRYKMPKTYRVEVKGELTGAEVEKLLKGISSEGQWLHAERIFQIRSLGYSTELHLVLGEGKKRQIRRMMAAVGHPVKRLVRLAIGPIKLGELKTGQWRYLTDEEIQALSKTSPVDARV